MNQDYYSTCDDHDWVGLGDHALQEDDVGVLELPHDAGLGEEVDLGLVRAAGLESLDGHEHVGPLGGGEAAAAHVAELSAADDGLDRDVLRVDLLRELLHGVLRARSGKG